MNYILGIFNFGIYNEGSKFSKELNFKLNSNYLLGDFKVLQNRRDKTWTPQAEFKLTTNWLNKYMIRYLPNLF